MFFCLWRESHGTSHLGAAIVMCEDTFICSGHECHGTSHLGAARVICED
jgi:hypothetical protein